MTTSIFAILGIFVCSIIGACGALFLKKGSDKISLRNLLDLKLITGILFYGIALVIGTASLRFGDLSVLYPLNSTTYIWVTLLSKYQLNEEINKFKVIGILLIILGVSVVGISR